MLKRLRYLSAVLLLAIGLVAPTVPAFADPQINEYPLTSGTAPFHIVTGSDGATWFTEASSNKIGRITTAGALTEYPVPTSDSLPYSIASAPDGNLWFSEKFGQQIGRITLSGAISEFPIPSGILYPTDITVAADGTIWFLALDTTPTNGGEKVFKMTSSGDISEVTQDLYGSINIFDIKAGPDDTVWISSAPDFSPCRGSGNALISYTSSGTVAGYHQLPVTGCGIAPGRLTLASDNTTWWFTDGEDDNGVPLVGNYNISTGSYNQYLVTNGSDPLPGDLTAGSDGAIWFSDGGNSAIGRITTDGTITEYSTPTAFSEPSGITSGSDGNIWFTEPGVDKIGEVVLNPVVTTPVEAINAGGAASGNFAADEEFTGGTTYTSSASVDTSNVSNPAPEDVYQSVRYGSNMTYTLSNLTPNAAYTLRLHFNELYFGTANGTGGIGSRVFNVTANGTPELTNFDIYQAAGGANRAVVEQLPVTANGSGTISVNFAGVTDNAMVSGLELYDGTLPTPTPPATVTSAAINAGGSATGSFSADTDFGGGGQTYSTTASVDTSGVTDPAPQGVYQTVRYGNFTYTVPNLTPNTNFVVRLHFSEPYFGTAGVGGGVGSRVFNVSANGTSELSNFDIYQAAGAANKAVVEQFTVPSDAYGNISLQFMSVTNNAMVNGIEITPSE